MFKNTPKLRIIVNVAWIEIVANCALKQRCILGNDCQSTSKVEESDRGCVEAIDAKGLWSVSRRRNKVRHLPDMTRGGFNDSKERHCQRTFPGTSSPNNPNLLARLDI